MSDEYTEIGTQGYFSRLGGSLVGVLIGIILLPAACILLYWNEGRAVTALDALSRGARQVIEIDAGKPDAAVNGKLVHLTGALGAGTAARDPVFGIGGAGLVRLRREVEMYQWREEQHSQSHENVGGSKTTETTYTYRLEWSSGPIASNNFHHPEGHANPQMAVSTATFDGGAVTLSAYRAGPAILEQVDAFTPLDPGGAAPPAGYRHEAGELYRGNDPGNPALGDLRIHFTAVQPQTYSVVAGLEAGTLSTYRGADSFTIALAAPGTASADQMFKAKASEEKTLTWILRGVGFVLVLAGFLLIARPFSMILAFLPFLEGIAEAGTFLVALLLAVPLTCTIIAIAWLAHRPVIGGLLLLAALGSLVLLQRLRRRPAPSSAAAY
jgi:hypothetical protein